MARQKNRNKKDATIAMNVPPLAPENATSDEAAGERWEKAAENGDEARPDGASSPASGETGKTGDGEGIISAEQARARARELERKTAAEVSLPTPKTTGQTLPSPGGEGGLAAYLQRIRQFPILSAEEEYMLAKRWREHEDVEAAHKLITSHLRLVARIAMGYRGYGLPMSEIISEGNVGLMQAVKRFEPDKGYRLATYAMWWIKAAIQEYILRSWSLVKIGTTAAQKKLFFNLRKLKSQISALESGDMKPEQVKEIAERLGVPEEDVVAMNRRLAGDASLNAPLRADEESGEWQDWLVDETTNQEEELAEREEFDMRMKLLRQAMDQLNDRERRIFEARRLREPPLTLEELSKEFGVSRERIRQIEMRAFEKVQKAMREALRDAERPL